ncbi:AraC family transcriptional regulator [Rhizobium sp. P40RR-XXII]|nr:AraC family transcriptional regulator [Rhizobium sp. P28RR-XV]NLS21421.1 AraC family transcriptional regulator [Rhizobium sp. P40RR-XXII]
MRILRPRAVLFAGVDASGEWALGFRERNDLLFCWVEQGQCLAIRPDHQPLLLKQGDFLLIRASTPFRLASSNSAMAIDSETAVASSKSKRLQLGSSDDRQTTLHAGKFIVSAANNDLLEELLPQTVGISASDPSVGRIRALLAMNEAEARLPGPASEFVIIRLVELILVEILRSGLVSINSEKKGLLAGLADRYAKRAIVAMHRDVARNWTVAELAKLCGVSRAGFAARFRRIFGMGPIEYLLRWRIALAKDELQNGTKTVAEIAFSVGFGSSSAFSSAFTRTVGCSPTQFARACGTEATEALQSDRTLVRK